MKKKSTSRAPMIEVRHSPIHGYGVFALRRIRKGTTVMEYLGERVSHARADARYEHKDPDDNHTFLFTVDARTVIDGGVNGNEARFINHGCDPNCESTSLKRRIFIDARPCRGSAEAASKSRQAGNGPVKSKSESEIESESEGEGEIKIAGEGPRPGRSEPV